MGFLLGYWKYLAVAGLVAAVLAYTYRIGGNGPRADLKAYKAVIKAEQDQARRDKERADDDYEMELANWQLRFDQLVRKHAAKPKPVVAAVCADQAGNAAIAAATGRYLDAMADLRGRVTELARQAGERENALKCVNDWAAQQVAPNGPIAPN